MKKRVWLILLMVVVMLFTFAACVIEDDPGGGGGGGGGEEIPPVPPIIVDPPPEEPVILTQRDALDKLVGAIPSGEVVNIDISADFNYNDDAYQLVVQGNAKEVGSKIRVALMQGEVEKVGLYVIDNKFYISSENNATLYLQDIDVNYLLKIIEGGSTAIKDLIDGLLSGIGFIDFDTVVDMLLSSLISTQPVLNVDGDVESYSFLVEPKNILSLAEVIVNLLGSMNIEIPIDVTEVVTYLGTIIPQAAINIDVEITKGVLSKLGLTADNEGSQVISMQNSAISFTNQEVDYNFNQAILNTTEFSLTNMQFSTTLEIDADKFDVGTYVNALVGSEVIPTGFVQIDTDAFEIRLDTSIDLDFDRDIKIGEEGYKEKNYIVLNLLSIEKDTRVEKTLINIYYIDGSFYIDFANVASGFYKGSLVKLNLPLNSVISQTIAFITQTIDEALGITYEDNKSPVITANILEDGTVAAVPTIESFLAAVLGILGQDSEEYVVVDGNTITLKINSKLISDIAGKFAEVTIPDFGNGEISVTLNEYGVGSIGVNLDTLQGLKAGITLSNFNMMYEPKFDGYDGIIDYINANLDESAYTDDLKTLVKSMLSATQVSAGIELTISQGTYNILDLITAFGYKGLEGATLNVELTQDTNINIALDIMIEMGETEDDFKLLAEIKAVGQSNLGADILFEDGELILGLYVVNGSLYIDLSNIDIAGINLGVYTQADFALGSFLNSQLDKINKKIEVDVSNMFGNSGSGESGEEGGEEGGSSGTTTALQGSIFLGLYSDSVVLDTTLSTVISLIKQLGVNISVDNIDLGINAKIDSNGLVLKLESTDDTFSGKLTTLNSDYPINIGGLDTTGLTERLTEIKDANSEVDEDIVKELFNTISSGKMTAEISVNQQGKVVDLTSILKTLIPNYPFDQELKLTIEEGLSVVNADIEWNLDLDNALATTLKVVLSYGERQLVTVTVVNGNMYVDLSGFGFGNLSIGREMTTGWINTLNTKILDALPTLDLNSIFAENKGAVTLNDAETNEPSGDDTQTSNSSLIAAILSAISIRDSQLMVKLTASTFEVIMQALGVNIALDLNAELTVDIINGDGVIKGNVNISGLDADLELSIQTGTVVPPVVNEGDYTDLEGANVNKLVRWLLSSTQVSAEIDLTLKAGNYNIIELLTNFGIKGLEDASLNFELTEDTALKLGLKVQVMLSEVVGETKMLVEIVSLTDTKLGADLLFNAGDKILGLYIVENDLYLDASAINLLGIKLGVYRQVDFQLEQFLNTKINEIGKEVAKEVINNTDNKAVEPVVLTSGGESDIPTIESGVIVGLSANKIVLKATLSAVIELLKKAGVNINLGNIDLNIDGEISLDTGIILNVSSMDGEFTGSIKALTEEYPIIIGEERAIEGLAEAVAAIRDGYTRTEENIVKDLINSITTGTINAEINFETVDTVIDLSVLLKQLIPTFALDAPMTLVIEDTSVPLAINLEYDIDLYDIGNTMANLTLSYGAKSLLNVIVTGGNMYIDLSGFGLGKVSMGTMLTGSWLDALAVKLSNLVSKINVDINDIFAQNKGEIEVPTGDTTETPATVTDETPATGESGVNMDIIKVILNSLNIRDSILMLELNALAVETIFSALGVNLDIDLSADLTIDLINPTESALNGTVYIEGNKANLSLGISNAEVEPPVVATDSYVDLGSDDFNEMGMRFLQGLDLNLSIDIVNNTGSKSNVYGYNVSDNIYTRISVDTLKANRTLGDSNSTVANAGDIVITVSTLNEAEYNRKGSGTVSERIYAVLRMSGDNAGKLDIRLKSGWLYASVIVTIDISTYIKDIYIDLGLLDMLGNLVKSMYLGEIAPEPETPVVPDDGSGEVTVPKVQYVDANNPILNPNALTEFFATVDISKILEAITVNLNGLDSINARIDFNAYTINHVIDGLMNCIFGKGSIVDMVNLDLFGTGNQVLYQNYLHQVIWDRVNPINFLNSFYEVLHFGGNSRKGVLGEIVATQIPSIIPVSTIEGSLNDIAAKITQFVAGILPLPVFNEIGVDINLTDMAIANVTLEGTVDGSAVVNEKGETLSVHSTANNPTNSSWNNASYTYDEATMSKLTSHYTRLTVYNVNSAIGSDTIDGKDDGIVTWKGITTDHAFIHDSYTVSGQEIYETYFNNGVASSIYQLGTTYKRSTSTTMSYTGLIGEANVSETLTPDLLTRMLQYPTTYTISITSTYSDGSTRTLDYDLAINDLVIESIVSPSIYAYDDLPTTVTINYSDGTQSTVEASSLNINYGNTTALPTGDSVINAVISMYNGAQIDYDINVIGVSGISVIDGVNDSITINPYEMQRMLTKTSPILNATITYTDGTTRTREIDLSGLDFTKLAYNTANTQTIAITEEYTGISWSRDFTINFSKVEVSGIFTDEGLTECDLSSLKATDTTRVYVQFSDGSVVYTDLYIRSVSPSGRIYYTIGYDVEYFNDFNGIVKGYQGLEHKGTI